MSLSYAYYYNSYAAANSAVVPSPPSGAINPNTNPPLLSADNQFPNNAWSIQSPGSIFNWKVAQQSSFYTFALNSEVLAAGTSITVTSGGGEYLVLYPATDGPPIPCFLEGSTISCLVNGDDTEIPIEKIRKGTLVKTLRDGYKKVTLIGSRPINNPANSERTQNRLYKLTKEKYPELKEDLFLTGCHSILVNELTEAQKEETIKQLEVICVTDKKYRLMANIDERAEPWASEGTYTVWHFALECEDDGLNFGVYANGGLVVETCSIRYLKNKSKMTFH